MIIIVIRIIQGRVPALLPPEDPLLRNPLAVKLSRIKAQLQRVLEEEIGKDTDKVSYEILFQEE